MPWVDVDEENPWVSSGDEGETTSSESPVLLSSGPVVVDTAPTIKKEPPSVVILEIPSSSPSPILKGEKDEAQDVVPELTGPSPTAAVPDGRFTSSRLSPPNADTHTPKPAAFAAPSVTNDDGGACKEERSRQGTPSAAHTPVGNRSAFVAAVSKIKRHSSSQSLSPVPTEEDGIDDDNDEEDDDDDDGVSLSLHALLDRTTANSPGYRKNQRGVSATHLVFHV